MKRQSFVYTADGHQTENLNAYSNSPSRPLTEGPGGIFAAHSVRHKYHVVYPSTLCLDDVAEVAIEGKKKRNCF